MRDYQDSSQEGGAIKVRQTQVSAEKKPAPTKSLGPAADLSSRATSSASLHKMFEANPALARTSLIHLQRQYGNLYVQRVVELARKTEADADAAPPDVQQAIERNRGGGQPVDSAVQSQMGQAFNADFSGVRVHTDSEADGLNRALQARAFTTGQDVFFRQGEYNPGSSTGRQLLAHELTHVVQQNPDKVQRKAEQGEGEGCACGGAGAVSRSIQPKLTVGRPGDLYEQEADRMAQALPAWEQRYGYTQDTTTGVQRVSADEEKEKEAVKLRGKPLEGTLLRQMEEEKKEEMPLQAKGMEEGLQRQGEGEEEKEM
jgi:hypothetical protein